VCIRELYICTLYGGNRYVRGTLRRANCVEKFIDCGTTLARRAHPARRGHIGLWTLRNMPSQQNVPARLSATQVTADQLATVGCTSATVFPHSSQQQQIEQRHATLPPAHPRTDASSASAAHRGRAASGPPRCGARLHGCSRMAWAAGWHSQSQQERPPCACP